VGRLLFAAAASGYILVGVRFEEHDLQAQLGEDYRRYAEQVPRFLPRVLPKGRVAQRESSAA
jgi:methanethiol S-methyltransferase